MRIVNLKPYEIAEMKDALFSALEDVAKENDVDAIKEWSYFIELAKKYVRKIQAKKEGS